MKKPTAGNTSVKVSDPVGTTGLELEAELEVPIDVGVIPGKQTPSTCNKTELMVQWAEKILLDEFKIRFYYYYNNYYYYYYY